MSIPYVTDHALASRLEYAEAKANVASIEARAARELADRGYRPIEQSTVLYQPLSGATQTGPETDRHVRIRLVAPDETLLWATTSSRGWGDTPALAQFMLDFGHMYASAAGMVSLIAEWDGAPAAAAALSIQNGVALLAGACTVPEFRRRGMQAALLSTRLAYGARRGCDLAMMAALPGSGSQRNAERRAFRIAYTRTKWALVRSAR